jgi:hypothetical protein
MMALSHPTSHSFNCWPAAIFWLMRRINAGLTPEAVKGRIVSDSVENTQIHFNTGFARV